MLRTSIGEQPEHSSVLYENDTTMLQRSVLVEEDDLGEAFERVPWSRLVFLRCDRQKGTRRILLYRWRAEPDRWDTEV